MDIETQTLRLIRAPGENRSAQLHQDLRLMKEYLAMCVSKEDWHGVMDASADIREIVARLACWAEAEALQTSRDPAPISVSSR